MKKIRCFIIDDDMHVIVGLSRLINENPDLQLVGFETDPTVALNLIRTGKVIADIVFSDINMEEMTGIELAEYIQHFAYIIFVTGHDQYALEAFSVDVVDFLLKPVRQELFNRAVNRVALRMKNKSEPIRNYNHEDIFLRLDSRTVKQLLLKDLVYIEAKNKWIFCHMEDKSKINVLKSLASFEPILPGNEFVRVHKSFIVHLKYIVAVEGNEIVLKDKTKLPIGGSYKDELLRLMNPL
ncbi:MAG: LytTR family DNA-binding domain-containing protein [Candidatus Pedobacter colombiensis]|uniref:LytTR family DNA-binding domain-containing protein n=1 Tax=Candidatus Pedobacter colombiensis TaxID=3121371 RepID=A0AAJ5W7E4_9SPHI|nr:LytTR family DNA-binding domain-containing protein [Pedobacter sp.]WEK17922.1 MAG: LytTR family DNA-binding domain-containing protein [Pedobacter sp.]